MDAFLHKPASASGLTASVSVWLPAGADMEIRRASTTRQLLRRETMHWFLSWVCRVCRMQKWHRLWRCHWQKPGAPSGRYWKSQEWQCKRKAAQATQHSCTLPARRAKMHVMPRVGAALSFSRSFLLKSSGAKNWPLGSLKVPKVKRNTFPKSRVPGSDARIYASVPRRCVGQ